MFPRELSRRIYAEPFEPFRIKLVIGDFHDVMNPQTVAMQRDGVLIASVDQHWVVFPFDKINSLESLLPDFYGELAEHASVSPPPAP